MTTTISSLVTQALPPPPLQMSLEKQVAKRHVVAKPVQYSRICLRCHLHDTLSYALYYLCNKTRLLVLICHVCCC